MPGVELGLWQEKRGRRKLRGGSHVYARTLIYFCCHFASGPHLKCAAGWEIKQIQMTKHGQ